MNNLIDQLQVFLLQMQANVPLALAIVGGIWVVYFFNLAVGHRLDILGIYPRHIRGLPGILFYSFLHADFNHLFFNSIPLFVLTCFMLVGGVTKFFIASVIIILLSGMAIWLFGRRAIHLGASSLTMGYWSYLLADAYRHPSVSAIILAVVCVYYFGGFLFDLFPREEKVSWEGHVFGFLAGLVAMYICN